MSKPDCDAIDLIPPAQVVRDRLAQTLRETDLLRSLLRVSEQAAEERVERQAVEAQGYSG